MTVRPRQSVSLRRALRKLKARAQTRAPRAQVRTRPIPTTSWPSPAEALSLTRTVVQGGGQFVMDRPALYLPAITITSFPLGRALMHGASEAYGAGCFDSVSDAWTTICLGSEVTQGVIENVGWGDLTSGLALSAWYLFSYYGVRGFSQKIDVPEDDHDFTEDQTALEKAGITAARGGMMALSSYWNNTQTTPLTDYSSSHPYRWVGDVRQQAQRLPTFMQPVFEALPETNGQMNGLLGMMANGALFFGVYNLTHGVAQDEMLTYMIANAILFGSLGGALISRYFNRNVMGRSITEQGYNFVISMGIGAMSTPFYDPTYKFGADLSVRLMFVLTMSLLLYRKQSGSVSESSSSIKQKALPEPAVAK